MKRHVKLFESFLGHQQVQGKEFIVGSVIPADGEFYEDIRRAADYHEGIEQLIEMIQDFRPEFERERQSDKHHKMYDDCLFFLGTVPMGFEPEVESGPDVIETDVRGVDMIERIELSTYGHQDLDAIVSDLTSKTRRPTKARNLFGV
jgi:hypothetical protein